MNFLKKLFAARTPEDCLNKGDTHFAAGSLYEARMAYESGLEICRNTEGHDAVALNLSRRLSDTRHAMAELNLREAEHAIQTGASDKAVEHLELAKTLTDEAELRKKADSLLAGIVEKVNDTEVLAPAASCSSCSHGMLDTPDVPLDMASELPLSEQYELLIHQLPAGMYERYASLGEEFACMFVMASGDDHQNALELLEKWFDGSDRDIYWYEKGKILHRMGRIKESEACFRDAMMENPGNPLAHLGLALHLMDAGRLDEAARQLDHMIAGELLTGQALMMRGEVYEFSGETEAAINLYGSLLDTTLAKSAAEKLYALLLECNRKQEAQHIFKRYLGSCKH